MLKAVVPTIGANLALTALGAVSGIMLSRLLSVDDRGSLAAAQVPALMVSGISTLGLGEAMIYFAKSGRVKASDSVVTATVVAMASSLLLAFAAFLLLPVVFPKLDSHSLGLARLWMLLPVVMAFNGMPIQALRVFDREHLWNLIRLAPGVLWILVIVSSSLAPRPSQREWIVGGQLIALTALGIVIWILLKRWGAVGSPSAGQFPAMLRYGLPLTLSTLPQLLNARLDQLLLIRYVSPNDLGLYVTAFAWSSLASAAISAFGIIMFPRLASATAPEQRAIFRQYFRPAVAVGITTTAIALAITPVLFPALFGRKYEGAVPVAMGLTGAGLILALAGVAASALQGLSHTKSVLYTEVIGLLVTGVLLAILAPRYGIWGAAVASMCSYTVTLGARLRLVGRELSKADEF